MVSRCFPGGYNVKLYISRGRLAWWLLAFLCCVLAFIALFLAVNAAGRWTGTLNCRGNEYTHSLAVSADSRSPNTLTGEYKWTLLDGSEYIEQVNVVLGSNADPTTFALVPTMWLVRPAAHG